MKTPTFAFSLPQALKERLQAYKEAQEKRIGMKLSVSAVICKLLNDALDVEEG